MLALMLLGCIRPTGEYDVKLYNGSTELDQILPPGEPMGGQIEYARFQMFGSNLGLGHTFFFGDEPYVDGQVFTLGFADFGYPVDPGYDRQSNFIVPGARQVEDDFCVTRVGATGFPAVGEYVDVGDEITLTADDGDLIRLERTPSSQPRPAGLSYYASWGGQLMPSVTDHIALPDTWRSGTTWNLAFPGTVVAPESSMGSVPYPLQSAAVTFPEAIEDLQVNGEDVRAPHHMYDDDGAYVGEDHRDEVRFAGPFREPMEVSWSSSPSGENLTIVLRYLGGEGPDGDGSVVLGDVTCTVVDDGSFTLTPEDLKFLDLAVDPAERRGAVLVVSRIWEGTTDVPDVLTHSGGRVPLSPVRTRLIDAIFTRLDLP